MQLDFPVPSCQYRSRHYKPRKVHFSGRAALFQSLRERAEFRNSSFMMSRIDKVDLGWEPRN